MYMAVRLVVQFGDPQHVILSLSLSHRIPGIEDHVLLLYASQNEALAISCNMRLLIVSKASYKVTRCPPTCNLSKSFRKSGTWKVYVYGPYHTNKHNSLHLTFICHLPFK
jgi:hypothetical protein